MNVTQGTPLYSKHSNITCNCPDCARFKNADTLIIERRRSMPQNDKLIAFEQIETINADTGEHTVYLWPLYQRDVITHPQFCTIISEI